MDKETEFKKSLQDAGITGYAFAKMTGEPKSTVYDWSSGKYRCPPAIIWGVTQYIKLMGIINDK